MRAASLALGPRRALSVSRHRLKPLPGSLDEARSAFAFWHTRSVEYRDLDAMCHVNNATYFKFFETVRVESWSQAVGHRIEFEPKGIKPVLSGVWCAYRRPVSLYDTLHIGLRAENVEMDSGRYEHRYIVWSTAQDTVAAEGGADVVMCDFDRGGVRCPVPPAWVEPFVRQSP